MKSYENVNPARVRGGYENPLRTPLPKRIKTEVSPSIREVKRAAAVIKAFCVSRSESLETPCAECPIREICLNEPYLWGL